MPITCTTTIEVTTMAIPTTQKAAVKVGKGDSSRIEVKEIPVPEPSPDQILVKVNYSGLCASDKSLLLDEWESTGLLQQPCTHGIAGHEGAGTVVAVGSNGMSNTPPRHIPTRVHLSLWTPHFFLQRIHG